MNKLSHLKKTDIICKDYILKYWKRHFFFRSKVCQCRSVLFIIIKNTRYVDILLVLIVIIQYSKVYRSSSYNLEGLYFLLFINSTTYIINETRLVICIHSFVVIPGVLIHINNNQLKIF